MGSTGATATETKDKILDIIAAEAMIDRSVLAPEAQLAELNIQSADYVMILMALEEEFGIYISVDTEISEAKTVDDLMQIFVQKLKEKPVGSTN